MASQPLFPHTYIMALTSQRMRYPNQDFCHYSQLLDGSNAIQEFKMPGHTCTKDFDAIDSGQFSLDFQPKEKKILRTRIYVQE